MKDNWLPGAIANKVRMRWSELMKAQQGLMDKNVAPCDLCGRFYHVQLGLKDYADLMKDPEFHKANRHRPNYGCQVYSASGMVLVADRITVEVIHSNDPRDKKWGRCPLQGERISMEWLKRLMTE